MDPVSHQEAAEFGEVASYVRCLVVVNATKTFITIYLVKEGMTQQQNKFASSMVLCYMSGLGIYILSSAAVSVLVYIQNQQSFLFLSYVFFFPQEQDSFR